MLQGDIATNRERFGPNFALIGRPSSRRQLSTPCLMVDEALLDRNIAIAAEICRSRGIMFRPHAKTHKCRAIAKRQIAAGAVGICVANVGEAEQLFCPGVEDIHITSTFSQASKIDRIVRLAESGCRLSVVVDTPEIARGLAAAAAGTRHSLPTLIDVDMGRRRSGVVQPSAAVKLAELISAAPNLRFAGVQAYAGHLSHVTDYDERQVGCAEAAVLVQSICSKLEKAGFTVPRITGGSTGTFLIDAYAGFYTELQCGSYIFNDVEYADVDLDGAGTQYFQPSLFVRASVLNAAWPSEVVTDAGHKQFAGKFGLPRLVSPAIAGAVYHPIGDEHGRIGLPDKTQSLTIGTGIECIVPHCDPTLNLFDFLHVVRDDTLIEIWPIEARGAA